MGQETEAGMATAQGADTAPPGSGPRRPQVLVTGAGGALARRVIGLLRADHDVVAVDFREAARLGPEVPSYRLDVTKRSFEDVFRRHRIEGIVHIGRFGPEASRESRYNANVLGSRRMFDLALSYGVSKVLVLSTFHVYGASPYNPALLDENAPLKASNLTRDLVDSVELENLATIYLWRYPELAMSILRPCHIAGPGVRNTISLLLSQRAAPFLAGFSPMMQFLHVDDMARAIVLAYGHRERGIYNVAPRDWLPWQEVLRACGCVGIPVPSVPDVLPAIIARLLRMPAFPAFLIDYFKYPVVIDGGLFRRTFGFEPEHAMAEIFAGYRRAKAHG